MTSDTTTQSATPSAISARRAWTPEADDEVAALLRLLLVRPWLVAGRDDTAIAAVRRNTRQLKDVFGRLGWVLVTDRDLVRLRKSPPPRREVWSQHGPSPLTCSWFFLLVAAAEAMPPRVGLAQLVTAARAAAAEGGLPTTGQIDERRAVVAALRLLDERGVVVRLDGDIDGFVTDENAPVLLAVHHTRLAHVIANAGVGDPHTDPDGWLDGVEREPDPARRMRRRLVDDALVHTCDLDDAEADWMSRRVKGDDGAPLAAAFGLAVERRAEGAAFVVPGDAYRYPADLGPHPFPVSGGTVPHAALLLCDAAAAHGRLHGDADVAGGPGPGWRALSEVDVVDRLTHWAQDIGAGRGGWSADLAENPPVLARRCAELLTGRDLLRIQQVEAPSDGLATGPLWWFSPATGRWKAPAAVAAARKTLRPASAPPDALFNDQGDLHP